MSRQTALVITSVWLILSMSVAALAQGYKGYATMPQDAFVVELGCEGSGYEAFQPGVQGGTLYVSTRVDPRKWNPITAHETSTTNYTARIFRGLVELHPITGEIIPELARSWEVSKGGLELTFYLRRGIMWSDGEPFTADDVLFTYNDLIFNSDVDCDARDVLMLPDGSSPAIEKVDDHTIRLTMSTVFRPILDALGSSIVPKHMLAQYVHKLNSDVAAGTFNATWGLNTDLEDIVGMGPFVLESYSPDQQVTMHRNPYYYHYDQNGTQLPYIDRYVVVITANDDMQLLKFRNGEIDFLVIRARDVPLLKGEEAMRGFSVKVGGPTFGTIWVSFNQDTGNENLRSLFRKIQFRKAIAHSLDKQAMIDSLYNGLAVTQWSPVSIPSPFYAGRDYYGGPITESSAVTYEYDLVKAASLLDQCGIFDTNGDGIREFEDGTSVEFELNTPVGVAQATDGCLILQADLAKIGVKANVNPIDFNTLVTKLFSVTLCEGVALGLTGGLEPNDGANVYRSTGGLHFWHFSARKGDVYPYETRIDELLRLATATFDNEEAFEYYKKFQTLFAAQDLGIIFLVNQRSTYAVYNHVGNGTCLTEATTLYGYIWDLVYLK